MKRTKGQGSWRWTGGGAVVLACAACGGYEPAEATLSGELALPAARQARVTVTPAVDLSGVEDAELASRLVVDQVVINLADVRLLGSDPRIPAGGLPLLDGPRLVYAEGDGRFGIELPFPREFLGQEDLAVYLRTEPTDELEGAAMQVITHLQAHEGFALSDGAVDPEGDPLREGGAVDPEGDPLRDEGEGGAVDPEGDPLRATGGAVDPEGDPLRGDGGAVDPEGDPLRGDGGAVDPEGDPLRGDGGAVDPEGDPLRGEGGAVDPEGDPLRGLPCDGLCQKGFALQASPRIILIDDQGTELVTGFKQRSMFNIIFGIRAAEWLNETGTPSADDVQSSDPSSGHAPARGPDRNGPFGQVVEATHESTMPGANAGSAEGYYLGDGLPTEGGLLGGAGGL